MTSRSLTRVDEELHNAARLLQEADVIGLWSKSDDCSDNRNKRRLLREADWAVSGALRAVAEFQDSQDGWQAAVASLSDRIRALVELLEPLPPMITDTKLANPHVDGAIQTALDEIARLIEQTAMLSGDR